VVRAMRAAFDFAGGQPPGIRLRCVNRIPHGRGLGSSAAAIVGGILAARALAGQPPAGQPTAGQPTAGQPTAGQPPAAPGTAGLPDEAAFRLAAGLEGHPDNVAACLGGGLTVAWMSAGHPRMARLDVLAPVTPVVCVAPAAVRTELVRGILPGTVPHRDAAANAGRSALLVAVLTRPPGAGLDTAGALLDATEDWLHQNYRAGVMPETHRLLTTARAAGLPAVVSGAGPSVLVFLPARGSPDYRRHLERLGSIVRKTGTTWRISSLDVERHGARVLRPEPEPGP
jgi:homoserine kinase